MLLLVGCASPAGTSANLPLITPLVRGATPAGLDGASARVTIHALDATLSPTDIRDRFFSPGPTEVFQILQSVDDRIAEVNMASAGGAHACLGDPPVGYTMHVFGQDVPFAAQCFRTFTTPSAGPPAFMQFGSDGTATYLFVTGGAARLAARVEGDAVDVWYGVGYTNASCGSFDGCSYGVTQIAATPSTHAFEMTVAGVGVGYCGVQLRSDGTLLFGEGSTDMGETCNTPATLCANAADLSPAGSCDAVSTWTLPSLGRDAGAGAHVFGASQFPDAPAIVLAGTATDSLGFGPGDAPTAGVGDFDAP
jgi:hypothetical protein